jgi:hypothetical protein
MDGNTIVLAGKLEEAMGLPAHLARELAKILDPLMPIASSRESLFRFLEDWTCRNKAKELNQEIRRAQIELIKNSKPL